METYSSPGMPKPVNDGVQNPNVPKIGKFKASRIIARESWNLLKKDKEMLAFPILSAIASVIALGVMGVVFFFAILGGSFVLSEDSSYIMELVFAFIGYFVTTFITVFFQVGIIAIVRARLARRDMTFRDGMNAAINRVGKIAVWSLVSATVGVILKIVSDRSQWIGKLVVSMLGAAWSILTFFIAPILVAEDLPIKGSLKRSAETIKKVWGEAVIVNVGVGFFFGLLMLGGFVLFIPIIFTGDVGIIIVAAVLLMIYIVALTVISSTLSVIFKVVLYEYANTGTVPDGFSPEVIQGAFKQGKKAKGGFLSGL